MRTPGLLGAAVFAALVLPSAAAADAAPAPTLNATGGKAKAYAMGLSVGTSNVDVYFTRTSHGSMQQHTIYATDAGHIHYTAKASLSSAKIKATFGSKGKVSMRFTPTGKAHKLLPKGCTGKAALTRRGVLKGTLKVKLDKHYFRTVKRTRMSATLSKAGSFSCGPGGGFGGGGAKHVTALNVNIQRLGQLSGNFSRVGHAKAFETVGLATTGTGYELNHSITVAHAPSSSISAAKSRKTAKVKGAGPFLAGTAKFTAAGPIGPTGASGKMTGSFVAKFDSIGHRRFSSKQSASLTKT